MGTLCSEGFLPMGRDHTGATELEPKNAQSSVLQQRPAALTQDRKFLQPQPRPRDINGPH